MQDLKYLFCISFLLILISFNVNSQTTLETFESDNYKGLFYSKKFRGEVKTVHTYRHDIPQSKLFLDSTEMEKMVKIIVEDETSAKSKRWGFKQNGSIESDGKSLYFYDENGYIIQYEDRGYGSGNLNYRRDYSYNNDYTQLITNYYKIKKLWPTNYEDFATDEALLEAERNAPDTGYIESTDSIWILDDGSFLKDTYWYSKKGEPYLHWRFRKNKDRTISESISFQGNGSIKHTNKKNYDKTGKILTEKKFNSDNEETANVTTFIYDESGRIIKRERKDPMAEHPYEIMTTRNNINGDVIFYSYLNIWDNKKFTYTYYYIYDNHENWIAKYTWFNGKPESFEIREIEYWE